MKTLLPITDLLSHSRQEIQKRFGTLFGVAFSATFITQLLQSFIPTQAQTAAMQDWSAALTGLALSVFLFLIITLIGMAGYAALILCICKHTGGLWDSWKTGLTRLPRLVGGSLLMGLFMAGLILASILAMILAGLVLPEQLRIGWFALCTLAVFASLFALVIYWVFVNPLLVLTDTPIFSCFSVSYHMVKGHFWHVLGLVAATVGIMLAVLLVALLPFLLISLALKSGFALGEFIILLLTSGWLAFNMLIVQVPTMALYLDMQPTAAPQEQTNA